MIAAYKEKFRISRRYPSIVIFEEDFVIGETYYYTFKSNYGSFGKYVKSTLSGEFSKCLQVYPYDESFDFMVFMNNQHLPEAAFSDHQFFRKERDAVAYHNSRLKASKKNRSLPRV